MLCCLWAAEATCPEADQIHCASSERCTRIRYICDNDNDCGDGSDEDPSICEVWKNTDCVLSRALCKTGSISSCVSTNKLLQKSSLCEGSLDPRICQMLRNEKLQALYAIQLTTPTPEPTVPAITDPSIHMKNENWSDEFLFKLNNTIRDADCPWLYTKVGKQCLSVFFLGSMGWMEARTFCKIIGGDLFSLKDDLNVFSTVLHHLRRHLVTADFWVGGGYVNDTLGWTWLDNSPMYLGSPLWAVRHQEPCVKSTTNYTFLNSTMAANDSECYKYVQAPTSPPVGHCASLSYEHYHYLTDEDCFAKKSPLCVMPNEHPKQAL
ncbi:uncharacterized protein LOC121867893 isoform X2 [Homarus americanus]|nr:uncharacterized protein LOC121867893 isoform X2 [Homarus americanus]